MTATPKRLRSVVGALSLGLSGLCLLLLGSRDGGGDGPLVGRTVRATTRSLDGKSQRSSPMFRRVFMCDLPYDTAFLSMFFPEYWGRTDLIEILGPKSQPTKYDLLLSSYSIAEVKCAKMLPSLGGHILNFPGKMLFFNQEASDWAGGPRPLTENPPRLCPVDGTHDDCWSLQGTVASQAPEFEKPGGRFNYLPPSDRAYVIGPHSDSERSVRVPLAHRMDLHANPRKHLANLEWLFDHTKKPLNTGENFAVILASHCVPFRDEAAKRVGQLGVVHVGPSYRECMDATPDPDGPKPRMELIPNSTSRSDWERNAMLFRRYKFALVMENTYREGYITEKLVNAFQSGAVPVWYGGRDALDAFNPKAFVYYDVEDPRPALDRIRHLMENEAEYGKVLGEPILRDGNRTIERYFSLRDEIGGGRLKKRIRKMMGVDGAGKWR